MIQISGEVWKRSSSFITANINATRRCKTELIRKRSGAVVTAQFTHPLFDQMTPKYSELMTISCQRLKLLFFLVSTFAPCFTFTWTEILVSLGCAFQVLPRIPRHKKALLDKRQAYYHSSQRSLARSKPWTVSQQIASPRAVKISNY